MDKKMLKLQAFESRQTMKKETFEVFHYVDRKPQTVSLHHHDFYELYYFISGPANYQYRVESSVYQLRPGSLLLTSPMELHQPLASGDEDYERIVLWIDPDYLHRLSDENSFLGLCFDDSRPFHSHLIQPGPRSSSMLLGLLKNLVTESHSDAFGAAIYAESLLRQLLVELNRLTTEDRILPQNPDKTTEAVSAALDYINRHYSEKLTLESLAADLYVSKYYLAHEFKESVGISLYRYILLKRLMIAGEYLSEGMQPSEVCRACGFSNYSNFYRAFQAEYGSSPRDYAKHAT